MNALTKFENAPAPARVDEVTRFDLMQRQARLYASSPLIPQHLRNGGEMVAMANCYIGLQMADAMGENPLIVLQNIHVVNGKAGFDSKYMIGRANASGVFKGGIDWRVAGSGASLAVTAFATLASTGREVSFTADMAMAKAEGWTKNAKYSSMPELMLRYRSAAFLVRLYCPQVMFGFKTREEVEDLAFAEPSQDTAVITAQNVTAEIVSDFDDEPADAEITDPAASQPIPPQADTGGHSAAGEAPQTDPRAAAEAWVSDTLRPALIACDTAADVDAVEAANGRALAKLARQFPDLAEQAAAEIDRLRASLGGEA